MSLAFSCLICARPAHAQGPGGGSSDGWVVTYDPQGTATNPKGSYAWTPPPAGSAAAYGTGSPQAGNFSNAGTITAVYTWTSAKGTPPPLDLYAVLTAEADAYYGSYNSGPVGTGTADDGLGDFSGGSSPQATSKGTHYHREKNAGRQSVVRYPVKMSAIVIGTTYGSTWVSLLASVDSSQAARSVSIYRDGAHNETTDADGTVHGDTRFSYSSGSGLGAGIVQNTQVFHARLAGVWSSPNWQWNPAGFSPPDKIDTHSQLIPVGSVSADGAPQQWVGQTDAPKPLTITYTAIDSSDGAAASARYLLTIHDEYEKWHRVSSSGGSIDPSAKGDAAGQTLQTQADSTVPGTGVLTVPATPVEWNTDESVGGGFVAAGGAVCTLFQRIPTWGGVLLGLAGLGLQTAASVPPASTPLSPPDRFTASFLQAAFQNATYNQTAHPGEENTSNLTDLSLFLRLQQNPDFSGYFNGRYGTVSVTTTLYAQMLRYYFQADKYDNGGLVTHTSPGSATKPGGNVWQYLWHCAGTPTQPGASSMPML